MLSSSHIPRRLLAGLFVIGAFFAAPLAARAQSSACQQIQAELAALPRGREAGRNTAALRQELGRVQLALENNACHRSRGLFGLGSPPAVCAPLHVHADRLQTQIEAAEGGNQDAWRARLVAAWQRYGCDTRPRQSRSGVLQASPDDNPGIFERIFSGRGDVPIDPFPRSGTDVLRPEADLGDEGKPRRRDGLVAACVRTCDGFFFPVNFEGMRARNDYEDLCSALCPDAQTRVYFMPQGGSIDDAASRDGEPYSAQPYARKYRESRSTSCNCKQPGQTWANAMRNKPDLLEMRKGDILVSREQAEIMSRPRELRALGPRSRQKEIPGRAAGEEAPFAPPKRSAASAGERGPSELPREEETRSTIRNVAPAPGGSGFRPVPSEAKRP